MQRVPKKPNEMKADLQNSTARLSKKNLVSWLMEADSFRYNAVALVGSSEVIPVRSPSRNL